MSFLDFFWPPSKKQRQQANTRNTKSLQFETLEDREMLSINSILSAQYTDTIASSGSQAAMYLELTSDSSSKWVTVGLVIEAAANSNLDPSKITVKYQNTENDSYVVLPDWAVLHETDGTKKSTIIFEVPAGTYQVLVGGDNQTIGTFTADVYVPGATKENPTTIPQHTLTLVQTGLYQMSSQWNMSMEAIYKKLLGTNYNNNIPAKYPDLNVTGTGRLNARDAEILSIVARSGDVTAKLTKTEPQPGDLTFSAASLSTTEKATTFGDPTTAITVTGGSSANLKDYNVSLSSTYTIASSYGGVNLSGVTLPALVAGTDYKFEDGKFYFNPNGKFNFIPKGTTATLTLTFTATDKTDATKTGTGTITVAIVGANDTPEIDKSDVDITPGSSTPVEIWSEPWSTTTNGVTTYHSDEVALVIDGRNIKIGDTVIATISDPDIGDTFEFATIGYPAGSVTFENSTWTLWNGADENKKAIGEIRLSTDKRTLYYKAAGARSDSAMSSLEDGELSDKLKFTFTVTDNHKIASQTGEDEKSGSNTCAVEFQVRRKVDAQMGLSLTRTGTTSVSIKSQSLTQDEKNPKVELPAFFTIDYTGEKILTYSFVDVTITGSPGLTVSNEIATSLRNALEIDGFDKTSGVIRFNRSTITSQAETFLKNLTGDQYIDVTFKVKVVNAYSESEYVISETLHIFFREATSLVVPNATLSVSQHDTTWISSAPVAISGGVSQVSPAFYEINFTGNPVISYPSESGEFEKPVLVAGVDYKCEIVVMNQTTGQLGIVFSFNPNGKFNFLEEEQNATVQLFVFLKDKINPTLEHTSEVNITIHGEAAPIVPTFKSNTSANLNTNENQSLTIEGKNVAESAKSDANLVIDEVRIKVEEVELINGTAPNPSVAIDGFYVLTRPSSDEQIIQLKSGTIILLDGEGKIKFDPTGRTEKLQEGDYVDEKITLLVKDISGTTPIATATAQEFSVRVKGVQTSVNPAPTFKTIADGALGAFQNETCTITADDLASSTKSDAVLRIKSITLIPADVESIDGATLGSDNTIARPQTGEITITFKSGTVITFKSDGTLIFDPSETVKTSDPTKPLDPYVNGNVETFRDETLGIIVEDISPLTPVPTETTKDFKIRAKGIIYPVFNTTKIFPTPENIIKTIKASDIASSTKADAQLVIEEVYVKEENVEQVNGVAPGTPADGMYKIVRPTTGTQTILLKSGSLITLNAAGEVTFDPTGRSGELAAGTFADEKFELRVKDLSDAGVLSKEKPEFTVRVQGVEPAVVPTFRTDTEANLSVTERNLKTIYAEDIAESTKANANLKIVEVYVKADQVSLINEVAPTEEPDENGMYKIVLPTGNYENTITLVSGSLVRLLGGYVIFNPNGRTGTLPPYNPSDPATYADEKVSFLVRDISSNPATETESIGEFTIRVKGEQASPSEGLQVTGGPFQVNTFATVAEIPENYAVTPTYRVDGAAVGTDYTFSLVEVRWSFDENGTYYPSSLFSVGADGKILVNKEALVQRHETLGDTGRTVEYYKITVKAVKEGTETELEVEVPLTLRYVVPPEVQTVTTLDGEPANAKWELSKADNHQASIEITVTDLNDFSRTGQWYTVSEIVLLDWKYGGLFESWTKSQVEAGKDAGDAEMIALYNHVASLLNPAGTAWTLDVEELTEADKYQLNFNMITGSDFAFIGLFFSLELQYELIVMDNDYLGKTPIRFTIVVQG